MIEICINPENENFSGENVDVDADMMYVYLNDHNFILQKCNYYELIKTDLFVCLPYFVIIEYIFQKHMDNLHIVYRHMLLFFIYYVTSHIQHLVTSSQT